MWVITNLLRTVVLVFLLFLIARLVIDWIQVFSRDWRPRGAMLVVAETTYSVTDPPLRQLRRVIPPLRLGVIQLDLAFMILFMVCWILLGLL